MKKRPAAPASAPAATPAVRVVLVEPEGEINLGSVARAAENFGVRELVLVRPKAKLSFQAKLFAKHAWPLLKKARAVKTVEEAAKGCSFVAGTTGVPRRFWRGIKNCLTPAELAEKAAGEKIALVFGNEGTGLGPEDLKKCDAIASIPTSEKYPVMNLSHSVAVMLYALRSAPAAKPLYEPAARKKLGRLESMFAEIMAKAKTVHDKGKVTRAFAQVLARARPGDDEAQALFAAMSGIKKAVAEMKSRK